MKPDEKRRELLAMWVLRCTEMQVHGRTERVGRPSETRMWWTEWPIPRARWTTAKRMRGATLGCPRAAILDGFATMIRLRHLPPAVVDEARQRFGGDLVPLPEEKVERGPTSSEGGRS